MNIAALGNVVPQLHAHVIARYHNDLAWPQPVWSSGHNEAYGEEELEKRVREVHEVCLKKPSKE
jgi:diadenosine tetraphosphate (Ap4A) HIT family hydrolase